MSILSSIQSLISPESYWYAIMAATSIFPLFILTVFELDNSPVSFIFLGYLGFVQYFGVYDIISVCTLNTVYILPAAILYCVAGTLISLLKWWIFVRRDTERNKLMAYSGDQKIDLFNKYVSDHSVKIRRWILLWPMALINLFLGEIYRFVVTIIFENLYNKYVAIAIRAVSNLGTFPDNIDNSPDYSPKFHTETNETSEFVQMQNDEAKESRGTLSQKILDHTHSSF